MVTACLTDASVPVGAAAVSLLMQIRHKDELERRLREIEDARRIFSRPNVLVHAGQQQ
jgi:hypothetical protein